jgi:nitrate reductase assembly molybdenum cofactor insertion protein NarJ
MESLRHYDDLAALFDYPGPDYPVRVWAAHQSAALRVPEAGGALQAFAKALPPLPELQEIFTRSFDVQAITTLSVGYLLFGDDYKRGALLANLHREQEAAGVDVGVELPDHLPAVLRLVARWADRELATELVQEVLRPAVDRMIAEFSPDRMERRDRLYARHFRTLIESSSARAAMFREPLVALARVLEADFGALETRDQGRGDDFLRSLGRELEIETTEGRPAPAGRLL